MVQNAIGGADNFVLMAVPFFILAGEFMNQALSRRHRARRLPGCGAGRELVDRVAA
jgi:hypothetical protein